MYNLTNWKSLKNSNTIKSQDFPVYNEDAIIAQALGILERRIQAKSNPIADPQNIKTYLQLAVASDDREMFGAVIFYHNHPSGRSDPSEADKHMTNKLKSALQMVDIKSLDHIIVSVEST